MWISFGLSHAEFVELLGLMFLFIFGKVLALFFHIFFLPHSFFFPFEAPFTCMLTHLVVPQRSLRLCSFSFILLFFSSLDRIISTDPSSQSQILSSGSTNLLLSPFSEFFISVTVLYRSRISICFFKSISIDTLHLMYIILVFSFNPLDMVSYSSLNIINNSQCKIFSKST